MKPNDLLFVYGTLRKGERASLARNMAAEYIDEDKINGRMYSLGSYPGVKTEASHFNPGEPCVTGDIFRLLDEPIIQILDHYEGYPSLYDRIETETANGLHVWVYVYNYDVHENQLVVSGDWRLSKIAQTTVLQAKMGEMG